MDTDGDGLEDGEEVTEHGTDPTNEDTDGGSVSDGDEVERGTDPLDPADDVPGKGEYYGGCAVAPAPGPAPLALLLGLLGLAALRRRT